MGWRGASDSFPPFLHLPLLPFSSPPSGAIPSRNKSSGGEVGIAHDYLKVGEGKGGETEGMGKQGGGEDRGDDDDVGGREGTKEGSQQ